MADLKKIYEVLEGLSAQNALNEILKGQFEVERRSVRNKTPASDEPESVEVFLKVRNQIEQSFQALDMILLDLHAPSFSIKEAPRILALPLQELQEGVRLVDENREIFGQDEIMALLDLAATSEKIFHDSQYLAERAHNEALLTKEDFYPTIEAIKDS